MRKSIPFLLKGSSFIRFNKINLRSPLLFQFSSSQENDTHDDFKKQNKVEGLPENNLAEQIEKVSIIN